MEILKKISIIRKRKNESTVSAILYTLETAFHLDCQGALRGNLLTVYTVSYIPPLSKSDCRKFTYSIIIIISRGECFFTFSLSPLDFKNVYSYLKRNRSKAPIILPRQFPMPRTETMIDPDSRAKSRDIM